MGEDIPQVPRPAAPADELRAGAGLLFDAIGGLVGLAQGVQRAIWLPGLAHRPATPASRPDSAGQPTPANQPTRAGQSAPPANATTPAGPSAPPSQPTPPADTVTPGSHSAPACQPIPAGQPADTATPPGQSAPAGRATPAASCPLPGQPRAPGDPVPTGQHALATAAAGHPVPARLATAGAPLSVVELAFGSVQVAAALGAKVTDLALDLSGLGRRVRPLQDTGWGRQVGAALNGAVGDLLASRYPALATPMRLRVGGHDLHPGADSLADAYPLATGHLVVLLHGLVHDEECWRRRAADGTPLPDFGQRLASDLGATALYVRYNSGRHISENGRELAELLGATVGAWPVPVRRLSLLGHSMGGLVARSAVHQTIAGDGDQPWLYALGDIVCLGSPHRGSGVERGAEFLARLLSRFGPSAPLAALVTQRSAGIKDLAYGYLDELDWAGHDTAATGTAGTADTDRAMRGPRYAIAPHGRQYYLAGTIARNPGGVPGRIVGDLLVTPASATDLSLPADRQAINQPVDRQVIGGLSHLNLLRHPRVYAQVRRWLTHGD